MALADGIDLVVAGASRNGSLTKRLQNMQNAAHAIIGDDPQPS
ncbi:MAG: hypothetical protein ACR2GH_10255 [Pseudonocardia sp.]